MTEIAEIYYKNKVEDFMAPNEYEKVIEMPNEVKAIFLEEADRIDRFANFCGISTIKELIQLGEDGVRYGNCECAYDNLYRLAKKCFKGQPFREKFASMTLYYFWQSQVYDMKAVYEKMLSMIA